MNKNTSRVYDLEERTALFAENIICFSKELPKGTITNPLINQLVRSSTSIGANYYEANGAGSRKDFTNKITICKKEARETMYWLRLISSTLPDIRIKADVLHQEAKELTLIFSRIILSSKNFKN